MHIIGQVLIYSGQLKYLKQALLKQIYQASSTNTSPSTSLARLLTFDGTGEFGHTLAACDPLSMLYSRDQAAAVVTRVGALSHRFSRAASGSGSAPAPLEAPGLLLAKLSGRSAAFLRWAVHYTWERDCAA